MKKIILALILGFLICQSVEATPLTAPERALFTAEQLAELDRMDDTRMVNDYLTTDPVVRAEVLDDWATWSAIDLKARVNIVSRRQSQVVFSGDNDWTLVEQQEVNDIYFGKGASATLRTLDSFMSLKSAYAEASALSAGPQQTGIGTTYVKITQFDTVGQVKNCTVADNAITVGVSGTYRASYSISFNGSASDTFTIAIHVNGTEVARSKSGRKLGTGGDVGNTAGFAIGNLTAGAEVDIRVLSDDAGGATFTVQAGNFEIIRIR